jgi:hypothetical protein
MLLEMTLRVATTFCGLALAAAQRNFVLVEISSTNSTTVKAARGNRDRGAGSL